MKLDVVDVDLQHVGRGLQDFLPDRDRRLVDGVAAHHRGAAGKSRDTPIESLGVAFDHDHVFRLDAELIGDDLGEHRVVALPLGRKTGVDIDLAGDRMDADMAAFVGSEPGAFDIAGKPKAQIFALGASLFPARRGIAGRRAAATAMPSALPYWPLSSVTFSPSANNSPSRG